MKSSTSNLIKSKRNRQVSVGEWNPTLFVGETRAESEELEMLAEGVTDPVGWLGDDISEETYGKIAKSAFHSESAEENAEAEALREVVKTLIKKKQRHTDSTTSVFYKKNEINAETFVWPNLEVQAPPVVEEEKQPIEEAPSLPAEPEIDLDSIRAEAEQILNDARLQAEATSNGILQKANTDGGNLLHQARTQSEEIILAAHGRESEITQKAYQEGVKAAEEQAARVLESASSLLNETQAWHEQMLANSETEVVSLLKEIAQTLFGNGLALTEEALDLALTRAMAEAKPLGNLRIRLHPEDLEILGPIWAQKQSALKGIQVELAPSETVLRGGCLIEGDYGTLDGQVDTRLHRVLDRIEEAQTVSENTDFPLPVDERSESNEEERESGEEFQESAAESMDFGENKAESEEFESDSGESDVIDLSSGPGEETENGGQAG